MIIEVENLSKVFKSPVPREGMLGALRGLFSREYRELTAVDRMNFSVGTGEMVGYIGANGAGKSTTIKMLTGILLPTSGGVEVAGFVPFRDRRRYVKSIGVVFGQRTQLWWDLAVIESFRLLGKIYEIPPTDFERRLGEFRELLELDEFLNTPVRKLSLGQRMRCDLTASLLHRPRILFLDEPTVGLDVLGKARVREFLKNVNKREQITVVLTTHDLDEIERLCPRIIIIDHGRKIFDGSPEELLEQHLPRKQVIVDFESELVADAFVELANRGIQFRRLEPFQGEFSFDRSQLSSAEVIQLVMSRGAVRDIRIEEPKIEDVVKIFYARRGDGASTLS